MDLSTNGTVLNKTKVAKSVRAAVRDGDLVCFASPDPLHDKCVAFTFHAYSDASFAALDAAMAAESCTAPAQPSAKRARPAGGAHDAAVALDLHAHVLELRDQQALMPVLRVH